jgi:hypothetical protein
MKDCVPWGQLLTTKFKELSLQHVLRLLETVYVSTRVRQKKKDTGPITIKYFTMPPARSKFCKKQQCNPSKLLVPNKLEVVRLMDRAGRLSKSLNYSMTHDKPQSLVSGNMLVQLSEVQLRQWSSRDRNDGVSLRHTILQLQKSMENKGK